MYSRDWHSWLPAANIAFARGLGAKDIEKYQPKERDFTNLCMFPLGEDDPAIEILISGFLYTNDNYDDLNTASIRYQTVVFPGTNGKSSLIEERDYTWGSSH